MRKMPQRCSGCRSKRITCGSAPPHPVSCPVMNSRYALMVTFLSCLFAKQLLNLWVCLIEPIFIRGLYRSWPVLENLESPRILLWRFRELKSPGIRTAQVLESSGNVELKEALNSFHFPQTSFTSVFPNIVWFLVSVWNLPQTYMKRHKISTSYFFPENLLP